MNCLIDVFGKNIVNISEIFKNLIMESSLLGLLENEKEWVLEAMSTVDEKEFGNSPAQFLFTLISFLFPQYHTSSIITTDKEMLSFVKKVFIAQGIQGPDRWSPILQIKVNQKDNPKDSIKFFNQAVYNIHMHMFPDSNLQKSLSNDLEQWQCHCKSSLSELEQVVKETQFYQDKINEILKIVISDLNNNRTPHSNEENSRNNPELALEIKRIINEYQKTISI